VQIADNAGLLSEDSDEVATETAKNVDAVKRIFSARVRINRSMSFKVIYFGTNQKCLCDFLLVRHSNLAPFQRYCRFSASHIYSTLILWVFPLDQIAHVGVRLSIYFKLISRRIIFEVL